MTDNLETSFDWVSRQNVKSEHRPDFIQELGPVTPGGAVSVQVVEVSPANASSRETLPDGAHVVMGVPLREIRRILGGDEGYWKHPATGESLFVSVKRWADRDPDTTLISVRFHHRPQR